MTDRYEKYDDPVTPDALRLAWCEPPFSVLDGRAVWQDRKARWLALGIQSELGRDEGLMMSSSINLQGGRTFGEGGGTSVFDPHLCELAYGWYSRVGDRVLDPFAGGSVRGLVAAAMGRQYDGVDLRAEQVAANREQVGVADRFAPDWPPRWHAGDSRHVLAAWQAQSAGQFDYVFSCPPYHDLEVYSSHPDDLSAMSWDGFLLAYYAIIRHAVALLAEDRFAGWVIGDVRSHHEPGYLRDLVELTIDAFADAGAELYDKAVLLTPIGSMPMRAGRLMRTSRKLCRGHQYLLVFAKGDARRAAARLGEPGPWVDLPSPLGDQLGLLDGDVTGTPAVEVG